MDNPASWIVALALLLAGLKLLADRVTFEIEEKHRISEEAWNAES